MAARKRTPTAEWRDTILFLIKLAALVLLFRSFVLAPFSIPSESMLPRLLVGDYLFVSKWSYGYSRYSLPLGLPLFGGRVFGSLPERGDVVVFKAPPGNTRDYIKRVIGLPGDQIQLRHGQVLLNGVAVPRDRVGDFTVAVTPNYRCAAEYRVNDADGTVVCRFPQYRETLPDGRSYHVLDRGWSAYDDTGIYSVPPGRLFLMGDNRDDSADSRFPQQEGGGIGMVPVENVEGKALVTFFSTDGTAGWLRPWTWGSATRWLRIGETF